ncbi:MAG: prepilin-type N-terminal cleavage/methylation domain-containing protein [Planctomycetes bacterium]|nr:prepilin-type N-terminal cleavage/methylation domain-containing protein [Planctomycetota bacterium]
MRRFPALSSRGFTLLEVTVTLALIGAIMATIYAVLYGTLNQKRTIEVKVQSSRIGPLLLDQIERDLRQTFAYNLAHGAVFKGEDNRIAGQDADKFSLVAQTPSTSALVEGEKPVFSAVNEVGYALTQSPENADFLILWRREDYFVDDEPLEGGKGTPLYRQIRGLDVTYYESLEEDADKLESWDSEVKGRLPAAMEILLKLEVEPRSSGAALTAQELERREYTYRRWITFPTDLELTMAVRPALPVPPGEEEDDGAGGAGSGDDDGGDDGDGGDGTGGHGTGGHGTGGGGSSTTTIGGPTGGSGGGGSSRPKGGKK